MSKQRMINKKDNSYSDCEELKNFKNDIDITLKDYIDNNKEFNSIFSFFNDGDKNKNKDDLIMSIKYRQNSQVSIQTGNYIGYFEWDKIKIKISSRFSNKFLNRMINFANDIYLDSDVVTGEKDRKDELDPQRYVIYYMFLQNLQKNFLLGVPKVYKIVKHHESRLKGKVDINNFIKKDIPFNGKISSINKERQDIQEIIDILYKAVNIIQQSSFSTNMVSHIKTYLKQNKSNNPISSQSILKAINSKALTNPIYHPYKKVLEYAKYVINFDSIKQTKNGKNKTYGFLINVAELFEIYIRKLLSLHFKKDGWEVQSPKIELYENKFYARKIIPDIQMINHQSKKILVFDTKYKNMQFKGRNNNSLGDVDREDFFQINTYMSYYKNNPKYKDYELVAGGLLYPLSKCFDKDRTYSSDWFGDIKTKFIIDGIEVTQDEIKEDEFITRIKEL